nr:uncharacterized protein LOC113708621 [Coffea arabica]
MGEGRRSSARVPKKENCVTGRTQFQTGTSSQPLEPADMPARIYELLQELHVELGRQFQTMNRKMDRLEYGLTLLMDESQRQQYQIFKQQQLVDNNNMEDEEGGEDEDQQEHHNERTQKGQNGGGEHERRTKARRS